MAKIVYKKNDFINIKLSKTVYDKFDFSDVNQ